MMRMRSSIRMLIASEVDEQTGTGFFFFAADHGVLDGFFTGRNGRESALGVFFVVVKIVIDDDDFAEMQAVGDEAQAQQFGFTVEQNRDERADITRDAVDRGFRRVFLEVDQVIELARDNTILQLRVAALIFNADGAGMQVLELNDAGTCLIRHRQQIAVAGIDRSNPARKGSAELFEAVHPCGIFRELKP